MMVFKRKQIVVLSLILMVIVAGYLQYSYKKTSAVVSKEDGKLGEAVYVDSQAGLTEKDNAQADNKQIAEKVTKASKQANDFFSQTRLDNDVAQSKSVDALKAISADANAGNDVKAEAYDKMMKIVDNSQTKLKIETLIKEKGFEDVIAIFAEDGSLDIIVKTSSLNSAQTAQIADIVMRHAKLAMDQIHIKKVY